LTIKELLDSGCISQVKYGLELNTVGEEKLLAL